MKNTEHGQHATELDFIAAERIMRALGSQLRMKILYMLRESPRCVHEIVDELGSSQPLISQHLKVLRTAGIVSSARQGREMYYSLSDLDVLPILEATFDLVQPSSISKL